MCFLSAIGSACCASLAPSSSSGPSQAVPVERAAQTVWAQEAKEEEEKRKRQQKKKRKRKRAQTAEIKEIKFRRERTLEPGGARSETRRSLTVPVIRCL